MEEYFLRAAVISRYGGKVQLPLLWGYGPMNLSRLYFTITPPMSGRIVE